MQLLKKYVITKGVVAENICPVWLHIKWPTIKRNS